MKDKKYIIFLIFIAIACYGCSSSTNSGPSIDPGPTIQPGVGSAFTYDIEYLDSTGTPITGLSQIVTDSVVETGLNYEGKSNVTHMIRLDEYGYPIAGTYYQYEANGDVYRFSDQANPLISVKSIWFQYPVQSHSTSKVTVFDTTIESSGQSAHVVLTGIFAFDGIYPVTINDSTLQTCKIKVTALETVTAGGITTSTQVVESVWFAPSVGYVTEEDLEPQPSYPQGERATLIRYTVR